MTVRIVQLGSPRAKDEGVRIGTVRRPPRGVPKEKFASQNWYDVWYPNLAPSVETMKQAQAAETPAQWSAFVAVRSSSRPSTVSLVSSSRTTCNDLASTHGGWCSGRSST